MPELPEVETIKRQLQDKLTGQQIAQIEIRSPKQFRGKKSLVMGAKITRLWRRAKMLGISLDKKYILLVHLKMTGQLIFSDQKGKTVSVGHPLPYSDDKLPNKTSQIIFTFKNGEKLFFNDLRKFGWIKVLKKPNELIKQNEARPNLAEFSDLGPEPLEENFSQPYLQQQFAKTRRAIKKVLLDQKVIAGIGNIYGSEILFRAGIDPRRPANQLAKAEVKKIYRLIPQVLQEAISAGGTSAADQHYLQADASPGQYQKQLRVYQREDQPCPKCGGKIKRIKQGGRSTYFCPNCQK